MDASIALKAQVIPDPNSDSQPQIVINDKKFTGEIYFDATKSEGRVRDDCTRIPKTLLIVLEKNGREIDRVQLEFARAFGRDSQGHYELLSPVTLNSRSGD